MTSRVFPAEILPLCGRGPVAAPRDIALPLPPAFLPLHKAFPATHGLPRATANRFGRVSSQGRTSNTPPLAEGPCRKAPLRHLGNRRNADRLDSPAPLPGSSLL